MRIEAQLDGIPVETVVRFREPVEEILLEAEAFDAWRRHLEVHGVAIEKELEWPKGGKSLYFRDPAGNSVELVTPGVWGLPSGW